MAYDRLIMLVSKASAAVSVLLPALHMAASEPPVKLSRETTYLLEPIGVGGIPDYLAAINAESSRGTKPETNAAVLLRKAIGFDDMSEDARNRYLKLLGTDIPIAACSPFVEWHGPGDSGMESAIPEPGTQKCRDWLASGDSSQEVDRDQQVERDYEASVRQPWSRKQYPAVHAWLESRHASLDQGIEASRCTQYYEPLVDDPERDPFLLEGGPVLNTQGLIRALASRAMLHCGEGKEAAAVDDLLACHRLMSLGRRGSTTGQAGPYLQPMPMVFEASKALICDARVSMAELKRLAMGLAELSRDSTWERQIGLADRCLGLRGTLTDARFAATAADRERALTFINSHVDRAVEALRLPTYSQRFQALRQIDEQWHARFGDLGDLSLSETLMFWHSHPMLAFWADVEGRYLMRSLLTQAACGLELYRRETGAFPDSLDKLVPEQLAAVPHDLFDGKPLRYERLCDGYKLYSVGKNGVSDAPYANDKDDIIIRYMRPSTGNR